MPHDSTSIKFKTMAKPICDVKVNIVVARLGAGVVTGTQQVRLMFYVIF